MVEHSKHLECKQSVLNAKRRYTHLITLSSSKGCIASDVLPSHQCPA